MIKARLENLKQDNDNSYMEVVAPMIKDNEEKEDPRKIQLAL